MVQPHVVSEQSKVVGDARKRDSTVHDPVGFRPVVSGAVAWARDIKVDSLGVISRRKHDKVSRELAAVIEDNSLLLQRRDAAVDCLDVVGLERGKVAILEDKALGAKR